VTDGRLTTHVLDMASGHPAGGLRLRLYRLAEARSLLGTTTTNADGRTDAPLLAGDALTTGLYEIEFDVGDYFRRHGTALASPLFLEVVPIRFGVSDAGKHYHVPLLLSPFGYSTYRGS
jgi:5-hydroxyisourate hydrolase